MLELPLEEKVKYKIHKNYKIIIIHHFILTIDKKGVLFIVSTVLLEVIQLIHGNYVKCIKVINVTIQNFLHDSIYDSNG